MSHQVDVDGNITQEQIRTFDTGATRDLENDKLDFEGFLSPKVLIRYAEYMHEHRVQKDGLKRASDNWQQGIPLDVYMKSGIRHTIELWLMHRDPILRQDAGQKALEDTLCAILFNTFGYLFELLRESGCEYEDNQNLSRP